MDSNSIQTIPTVNISTFTSGGSLEARLQTAQEFARCCQPHGCVAIVGHAVSRHLLEEAFGTSKRLFDLPLEDKMKAPHPNGTTPHRGYSATGREKAAGKAAAETDNEVRREELAKITDYKVGHYFLGAQ